MKRRISLAIMSSSVLLLLVSFTPITQIDKSGAEKMFKAVHLVNLKDDDTESEYLNILDDYNKVLDELGHQDIKYRVWKERGDRQGLYKYILESTWPDQETYDEVHNSERYKALGEKYKTRSEEIIKEEVYSRYIQLN